FLTDTDWGASRRRLPGKDNRRAPSTPGSWQSAPQRRRKSSTGRDLRSAPHTATLAEVGSTDKVLLRRLQRCGGTPPPTSCAQLLQCWPFARRVARRTRPPGG